MLPHAMGKLMAHFFGKSFKHLNQETQMCGFGRGTMGTLNGHAVVQQSHVKGDSTVV